MASHADPHDDRGPSWLWYILGALLVIAPPAGAVYAVTRMVLWIDANTLEFQAPGSATVTVESPTTYTVWNEIFVETESGIQKRTYARPDDVVITVTGADGGVVPIEENPNTHIQVGGSNRMSIANVTIDAPGDYTFDVHGKADQSFGAAVSPSLGGVVQTMLAKATPYIGLGALMFVAGVVMLIVTFIRRHAANQRRKEAEYAEIAAGF